MNQTAEEILNKYKNIVWPKINNYLISPTYPKPFQIPPRYKKLDSLHWKILREYPERKGKYLRPSLLILTAQAMGANPRLAINTAAAMQISEEWLLIHDDFEDGSIQRRGKPSLNKLFGNELSVNAGDALHIIMWHVLSQNDKLLGPQKTRLIIEEFFRILSRTATGQTAEIKWARQNKLNISDDEWFFVCDGKTSYYTIAGPMRLGGIISGAKRSELNSLAEFGVYLGRCFQLVDDILDITSDFNGMKQKGNDIYEGKKTIMTSHLFRNLERSDRKKLASIYRKTRGQKTKEEVEWVISNMEKRGSIAYAKNLAKQLKEKALEIFHRKLTFLNQEPAKSELIKIIDFILERNH